jgi:hypothetical protein
MKKSLAARCTGVYRWLPKLLVILFCLQPILDILSYWQDQLSIPFSLSFFPRMLILIVLALGGFALSEHKRVYWFMFGILAVLYAGHLFACYTNGIVSLTEDASNYIRVLQLPVTTICMITCLRCSSDCFDAIERGIFLTLLILAGSFLVSTLTGTEPHTYPDMEIGIRGYSFWPNAQSAILSLCAPVSIAWVLKRHPQKPVLCIAVMVLSLLLLYLHGTRLSFLCMAMSGVGMTAVILLSKGAPKKYAWILLGLTVLFVGAFEISPMQTNQKDVSNYTKEKATVAESLQELGKVQIENGTCAYLNFLSDKPQPTGMEAFAMSSPLERSSFSDIPYYDWRGKYIAYCQTLGILSGVDSTYDFAPDDDITAVHALAAADSVYEKYHGAKEYDKYDGKTWYDVYFRRAEAYGIMLPELDEQAVGKAEKTDEPVTLTRAQAAMLLYSALSPEAFPQTHAVESIPDVTEQTPYYEQIMTLYRAGVMQNRCDGLEYRPDEPITRGEFAVMLACAVNPSFRICDEGFTLPAVTAPVQETGEFTAEQLQDAQYYALYSYFLGGLVNRFGLHNVLVAYDYSTETETIISEREWKLEFCYLLMKYSTPISRVFGLEVTRMIYNGTSYDVENDFHGIYLLYGIVGLVLMLAFLGFFLFRIVRALIRNFKRYFTLEAGAIGIAILACLVHSYFTCGVLRRANTLFYFGALLAAAYYLVEMKQYPEEPKQQ